MKARAPKRTRTPAPQRWPFVKKRVYPNGSVGWQVDARTKSGGERKAFATKGEAETFADQCRVRRENEGVTAFGNAELAGFGKTVQDAIGFYLEHLRRQARSVPVGEAITELIAIRQGAGRSKGYCRTLRLRLGRFLDSFPEVTVAAFTSKELDAWLSGLKVAPGTRNTFRRDLRTLFSFCVKRGYCGSNPAAATEMAKHVDAAPGILTVEEVKRILKVAGAPMVPYVAIGLFAGLRADELAKLDWSEIDFDAGLIEVKAHKAKTSRRRLVKISDNLKAWIEPHRKDAGPIVPDALRYRWDDVKRAAGFARPGTETQEERKAGVVLREWPSNALRHSFGSYWLAKHQDAAALALQMGNSPAMVFAHYRELVKPSEASAFWGLSPRSSG